MMDDGRGSDLILRGGRVISPASGIDGVVAERLLRPAFCLRAGQRFDVDSPILPAAVAA
jgi:dihydroorotase